MSWPGKGNKDLIFLSSLSLSRSLHPCPSHFLTSSFSSPLASSHPLCRTSSSPPPSCISYPPPPLSLYFHPCFWTAFLSHIFLPVFVWDRSIFLFNARPWLQKERYVGSMINTKWCRDVSSISLALSCPSALPLAVNNRWRPVCMWHHNQI